MSGLVTYLLSVSGVFFSSSIAIIYTEAYTIVLYYVKHLDLHIAIELHSK